MHVLGALTALGGVASVASLRRAGVDSRALERATTRGDLIRVRMGWYADPRCAPELVAAVRAGGRLSCVTALRLRGAWVLDDRTVHVRIGRGATVHRAPGVRLHWDPAHLSDDAAVDPVVTALRCAIGCADLRHAVAIADSVLRLGLAAEEDVVRVLGVVPRGRRILDLVDPAAESGLESYARLGLRSLRVRVRSQVVVPGLGRVDLVVGDRLVLEVDGAAWHGGLADFERDRERDRRLAVLGYLVIRASYRQVMEQWPTLRDQVVTLVRRREHLWRRRDPGASWSEGSHDAPVWR